MSKKNILFYGNCQLGKIKDIMCLSPVLYDVFYISCFSTTLSDIEFDTILKKADIVITQPIHDNYRDMYYLASNYVVNKCKEGATIIFVNNCHFDFYYFDLHYNKSAQPNKMSNYYHDSMINCISNHFDVNYYREKYLENNDLKTTEELQCICDKSINELQSRYENMFQYIKYNTHFINVVDFIRNNYKNKLLFYTFNHPTKYLLQFIALEIIKIVGIQDTIDYHMDPFSDEKYILYSCIQKMVNFNIKEYTPFISNTSNIGDIFQTTLREGI